MTSRYNYYGNAGYHKAFSDMYAHPNSSVVHFTLKHLYTAKDSGQRTFLLELDGDTHANSYYGMPLKAWVELHIGASSTTNSLNFEVTFFDKTSTRLPEATFFRSCLKGLGSTKVIIIKYLIMIRFQQSQ